MIRRQYRLNDLPNYFGNFVLSNRDNDIELLLKQYNAALGKCKRAPGNFNVKWRNAQLYALFVLRWS